MRQIRRRLLALSGSFTRTRIWPAIGVLTGLALVVTDPVLAGDGSGTDNPQLLRGTYGLNCVQTGTCPSPASSAMLVTSSGSSSVSGPGNCAALMAAGIVAPECANAPEIVPEIRTPPPTPVQTVSVPPVAAPVPVAQRVAEVLSDPVPPAIDPIRSGGVSGPAFVGDDGMTGDWSIALRGSSTWDGSGHSYELVTAPQASLTVHRSRGELRLSAGTELMYEQPKDTVSIGAGHASIALDQVLTRDLMMRNALTLTVDRNSTDTAAGEAEGPLWLLGSATSELEKQAGRATFTIGAALNRYAVNDTRMNDGTYASNTASSYSSFGLTARVGYGLTPILSAFLQAETSRSYYDAMNARLGAREDNWAAKGTAGLSGKWRSGLEASLYSGYGLVFYDSALVDTGGGLVFGGSLSYPMVRGGALTASLDTTLTPIDSVVGASTEIKYAATAGVRYPVNDWLTLRTGLTGSWSVYPGSSHEQFGFGANAGLDWSVGPHTMFNADYAFDKAWSSSNDDPSHTVSVGMTLSR